MQVQNEINNDSIWRFIRTNDVLITLLAGSISTLLSQLLDLQKCFYAYSMYDYYDIKQNMMLISTGHISLDLMFLAPMLGYVSYIIVGVKSMNKRDNFRSCFLWLFIFPAMFLWFVHMNYTFMGVVLIITFHIINTLLGGYFLDEPWYNVAIKDEKENDESKKGKIFKIIYFIMIMMMAFTYLIYNSYFKGYNDAKSRTEYGIVNLNDENFAVIDSNTEKSVLKKCYINESDNIVVIQKNTYAIIDNNGHVINNRRFDSVKIED